jgi:hypothetical protein
MSHRRAGNADRELLLVCLGQMALDLVCRNRTGHSPAIGEKDRGSPANSKALTELQDPCDWGGASACCRRSLAIKHPLAPRDCAVGRAPDRLCFHHRVGSQDRIKEHVYGYIVDLLQRRIQPPAVRTVGVLEHDHPSLSFAPDLLQSQLERHVDHSRFRRTGDGRAGWVHVRRAAQPAQGGKDEYRGEG